MKNYRQMTVEERVQYNASFAQWYANRDQITLCVQQTGALDAAARAAFDLGAELMQAWPFGEQFRESLRCLPAERCVPRLMQLAEYARKQMGTNVATAPQQPVIDPRQPAIVQPKPVETPNTQNLAPSATSPLPIANLHIDQLVYLLSPKVAERARSLKAKLDERDIESNRAKDLAIAGASNDDIAPHAKAASDAQQFVTDTYALIDDELAEYVATELYMRTHRAQPEHEHIHQAALSNLNELARPFGSLDRLCAALAPYYKKANENGRIDRIVEQNFATYKADASPLPASSAESNSQSSPSRGTEGVSSSYDTAEYKRIWTYVNRKDVAHTQKRLDKMRAEIDAAKNAGMPNIDAMEAIYAHEAELVLAEQQKKLNDGEPSLL